jgi:hypothetical protein
MGAKTLADGSRLLAWVIGGRVADGLVGVTGRWVGVSRLGETGRWMSGYVDESASTLEMEC